MTCTSYEYLGALIICQADYQPANGFDPLEGVLGETKRLRSILKKDCRFDYVKIVSNLSKAAFDELEQELAREFGGKGQALWLVYYAGHGSSWNGQMLLVPVDARADDPSSLVNVNKFIRAIHDMAGGSPTLMQKTATGCGTQPSPGSLLLVVLSCCRQRPEKEPEVEAKLTLAKSYQKVTTKVIFMYSCDDGDKAPDRSVFGKAFCDLLATPGLKWFELLKGLRERTQEGHQRIWTSECAGEYEFVLNPQRRGVSLSQAGAASSVPPQKRFAWLISQTQNLRDKYGVDSKEYVEPLCHRLQEGGYEIKPHRDITSFDHLRRQMEETSHHASICVFYFTGLATTNNHGQTILLPTDSSDRNKGILLHELIRPLQDSKALVYVLLDACSEGGHCDCQPEKNLHSSVCVFYACQDNCWEFEPGIFTRAFAQALKVGLRFSDAWDACDRTCCELSGGKQRPWTPEQAHFSAVLLETPDSPVLPLRRSGLQEEAAESEIEDDSESGFDDEFERRSS